MEKIGEKFSIFWKIIFWICSMGLAVLSFKNIDKDCSIHEIISEPMGFAIFLSILFIFAALGYFWSLGYKKKLYSKTVNNINLGLLTLFAAGGPIALGLFRGEPATSKIHLLASILAIAVFIILAFVVSSPFYLALIQYGKYSDSFETIKAPFIKLLAFFNIITMQLALVFGNLYHYFVAGHAHTLKYYAGYSLDVYGLIFLGGVFFDNKIFPQKIWQYTSVPFVILTMADVFYDKAFIKDFINYPISLKLFIIIFYAVLFKILYSYAFTKLVYKSDEEVQIR